MSYGTLKHGAAQGEYENGTPCFFMGDPIQPLAGASPKRVAAVMTADVNNAMPGVPGVRMNDVMRSRCALARATMPTTATTDACHMGSPPFRVSNEDYADDALSHGPDALEQGAYESERDAYLWLTNDDGGKQSYHFSQAVSILASPCVRNLPEHGCEGSCY